MFILFFQDNRHVFKEVELISIISNLLICY